MKTLSTIFVSILIALTFASCQSNEEKLVREYLTTIVNADGSTTRIEIGKASFKSFETIDVNGKFIYSLEQDDSSKLSKDSLESLIKEYIHLYDNYNLLSVIETKRSQMYGPDEWETKYGYMKNSVSYTKESIKFGDRAFTLGKLYNNFDDVSFQLIKTVYDVNIGGFETKGITKYFVYDKENNKILKSFDAPLGEDFIKYYVDSVEGVGLNTFRDVIYDLDELSSKSLEELISML